MKKIILLFICLSFGTIFGQVGTVFFSNSIKYKITAATTVEVSINETSSLTGGITLPSTITYNSINYAVTRIGDYAFLNCTSLTSVTIPSAVTSIGENAFDNCESLTSVIIPNTVTTIGNYAFNACSGLTSVSIPNSVTSIGFCAFIECYGLTFVTISNSVTRIDDGTFAFCPSLTSVNIPNSVTSIGNYAFNGCSSLTSVPIPNSVTAIYEGAFYNCSGLTSVIIPNSVIDIGDSAFEGCFQLTSASIPNSITRINSNVFTNSGLTAVSIPNSVTSIGDGAFRGCLSLTSVTIPNSVLDIASRAFEGCTGLTSVTVNWATPLTIDAGVFSGLNLSTRTLNVPAGRIAVYDAAAVWTDFNPIIDNVTAPIASAQSFCNVATVSNLVATGTAITWYNIAAGGTALLSSVALVTGTYYVSQTVNSVESARTSVAVTINTTLAPTASAQTFNSSATVANLVATGTALKWYIVSTGGTSLSTSTPLATGTYYVSQTINGCESIRTAVLVTVTDNFSATSPINYCKGDAAAPLTATGTAGSTLKWYNLATGGTPSLIAPTPLTTTVGTKNYYVAQVVGGVESARVSITVNVNAIPTIPGAINGTTAQGSLVGTLTPATYSILNVAGATSYLWTPPTGVNIVSGQGTTSVVVNFNDVSAGAGVIGNLSVQSVNASGCNSLVRRLALTKALPAAPSKLVLTSPPSPSGQKDLTNISKYIGTTAPLTLTAATVATATSYDWELPTGVNRTDALGTNSTLPSITVNFSGVNTGNTFSYTNASGVLTYVLRIGVKAKNGVGVSVTNNGAFSNPTTTSTSKQLTLTAVRPAAVSNVTGQITGLCGGSSYTYTLTDTALASSYSVTAPAGAVVNFISSLTFTVTYPTGFVINASTTLPNKSLVITSVNGIGTSLTSRTMTLSTTMPAIASIIGGTTYSNCNQTFSVASIASAVSYTWTVPIGATIVSGQNTNTVVVNYGTLSGTQTIKVKTTNACGVSSAIKSLALTAGSCPVLFKENESTVSLVNNVKLYPNPTSSLLSIETTNNTTIDKVVIIDLLGKIIFEGKPENNQINVERYSSGTYIIKAFSGEEQFTSKFVKD